MRHMTDKKTKFDIANKILGEKIKQFEDNYRKKHLPESQEEKDKQSWVDDEGEWRCKKMRLAMTKKLKKEIKELFDELREYEREQGKLAVLEMLEKHKNDITNNEAELNFGFGAVMLWLKSQLKEDGSKEAYEQAKRDEAHRGDDE